MRLGGTVFCHTTDPQELVHAHQAAGFNAAYCPAAVTKDHSLVPAFREAFEAADIVIAEVGAFANLLDPDEAKRKAAFELTCARLAVADNLNAVCCVNCIGSFNPDVWWGPHPENFTQSGFDASVEVARAIVDTVKPRRARMAFEMTYTTWLDTPENVLKMMEAIERPAVAVHLDPVNLVHSARQMFDTTDLLNRCFKLLGPRVVSCHAKDIRFVLPSLALHLEECMIGEGVMDYPTFLRGVEMLGRDVPVMIEHLNTHKEYQQAADQIRGVARSLGIEVPTLPG